jgi:hypothetical protein
MDDNTKEVLVLLITTLSTIGIAWMKMRGLRNMGTAPPNPPVVQGPTEPGGPPGV